MLSSDIAKKNPKTRTVTLPELKNRHSAYMLSIKKEGKRGKIEKQADDNLFFISAVVNFGQLRHFNISL